MTENNRKATITDMSGNALDEISSKLRHLLADVDLFGSVGCGKSEQQQGVAGVQAVHVEQRNVPIYSEWVCTLEELRLLPGSV